jgi:hypothetical protein
MTARSCKPEYLITMVMGGLAVLIVMGFLAETGRKSENVTIPTPHGEIDIIDPQLQELVESVTRNSQHIDDAVDDGVWTPTESRWVRPDSTVESCNAAADVGSAIGRIEAVFALFATHVRPGVTSTQLAAALEGAAWVEQVTYYESTSGSMLIQSGEVSCYFNWLEGNDSSQWILTLLFEPADSGADPDEFVENRNWLRRRDDHVLLKSFRLDWPDGVELHEEREILTTTLVEPIGGQAD